MTSIELLDIIGNVDDRYVLEIYNDLSLQRRHVPLKRTLLIAAIITLLLLLVGCVAVVLKLQGVKIGRYTNTYPVANGEKNEITSDFISLQGFVGSANYQAAKEWREFIESYDSDGKLLKASSLDDYQASTEYMAYNCYTQEIQKKIDEICAKYNLELLGPIYIEEHAENLFNTVGIKNIICDNTEAEIILNSEYYYRDGTFSLSGVAAMKYEKIPWPYRINFEYRCVMKTAFDEVILSIGDVESYEQWNYTLKDGTEVLLALNEEKALLIADQEEYFVTVNILNPYAIDAIHGEQQMDKEALETFADIFIFDFVPQRPDHDTLG